MASLSLSVFPPAAPPALAQIFAQSLTAVISKCTNIVTNVWHGVQRCWFMIFTGVGMWSLESGNGNECVSVHVCDWTHVCMCLNRVPAMKDTKKNTPFSLCAFRFKLLIPNTTPKHTHTHTPHYKEQDVTSTEMWTLCSLWKNILLLFWSQKKKPNVERILILFSWKTAK